MSFRSRRTTWSATSSRQPAATVSAMSRGPRLKWSTVQPSAAYTVRIAAKAVRGSRRGGMLHAHATGGAADADRRNGRRSGSTLVVTTSPRNPTRETEQPLAPRPEKPAELRVHHEVHQSREPVDVAEGRGRRREVDRVLMDAHPVEERGEDD